MLFALAFFAILWLCFDGFCNTHLIKTYDFSAIGVCGTFVARGSLIYVAIRCLRAVRVPVEKQSISDCCKRNKNPKPNTVNFFLIDSLVCKVITTSSRKML